MFSSSYIRALPLIGCFLCGLALPALADVTMGANARDVAMGGAGLASGDAVGAARNPALLAESQQMFGVLLPSIVTSVEGAANWRDALGLIGNATVDAGEALDLVRKLGSGKTAFDISADVGLALPRADLVVSASMHAEIIPNAEFASWVRSGVQGDLPEQAQADLYAGGLTNLPSLGFGFYLPQSRSLPGTTAVGFRVKPTQVYYSHYVYDAADPDGRPAEEMGGKDYLKQTSVSVDMGLLYTPKANKNVRVALMVNNWIEPKAIAFAATSARFGDKKQLAPRTLSIGTAWVNDDVTMAVDLVDLTGAQGDPQLRLGGELRLPNGLALRGGYNTKHGLTAGIGIGNVGLAYSAKTPVMLSSSVVF